MSELYRDVGIVLRTYKLRESDRIVVIMTQDNGKVRGKNQDPKGCSQNEAMELAKAVASVGKQLDGKDVTKIIFVQDKILNIVAK